MRTTSQRATSLGGRIRVLREARGMTQAELAEIVGMHREDLVRLETGSRRTNPTHKRLMAIADALRVGLGALHPSKRRAA